MGGCCEKRSNTEVTKIETKKAPAVQGGIISTEVPKLLEFVNNPDHDMIALNLSKDMFKPFLANLAKLMGIIKDKTGQILVPVALQSSPLNPNTEMVVILRKLSKYMNDFLLLGQNIGQDVNLIAQRFVLKQFQFLTKDEEFRATHLNNDLMSFYNKEGLILIGGIQEKNLSGSFLFLYFKYDKPEQESVNYQYLLEPEIISSPTSESLSRVLQKATIKDQVLRCVITLQNNPLEAILVLQQEPLEDDPKVYEINDFNRQDLTDLLMSLVSNPAGQITSQKAGNNSTSNGTKLTPGDRSIKEQIMWGVSEHLNMLDESLRNEVQALIMNQNFEQSFIISVN
ncbi:UNKNOWN [Stylonychia lemnae]|uniref:Uncharacterized protein n=1 Tax=Stylonychia lemnae TaxID=5949 RepID=A0A078AJH7_STYLE|nr:UNKNOWN [Stylonychia lemnae]|eukprot:CDW82505.1 UNKNOWN [Stylonychia lemnae]